MRGLLKVILSVALAFAIALTAFGQAAAADKRAVSEGSIWVDGGVSFSDYNVDPNEGDDVDISEFSLAADMNYFVIKRLGIGALVNYAVVNTDPGDDTTALAIGPEVRYAFDAFADKKLYPFVNAAVGIEQAHSEERDEDQDGAFWLIGGGLNYAIRENLGVIGTLNYQRHSLDDYDLSGIFLGIGLVGMF